MSVTVTPPVNGGSMMKWGVWFLLLIGGIVAVNLLAGLMSAANADPSGWALLPWGATVACLVGCCAIVGGMPVSAAGQPARPDWRRILIDQRNKISLSRLQLVLWSLLVISAVTTFGMLNALWGSPKPLALNIPHELWILLGLSSASFVAAPMVLETKAGTCLHTKAEGEYAWWDIFYGDDTGNADQVDFSKVQQFFFTLVLIGVYTIAIGTVLAGAKPAQHPTMVFPALDPGFIGIMTVSQVAYIAYKALPQNKTDAPND
ncbi:MAG TPA: hypothetical protein VFA03_08830 [Acetobacteraceae bacterium]|nr:hypothetical protein [Acetobacteraceae bacterium]